MITEELKKYLTNRFSEILIGEVEIDRNIKEIIIHEYMNKVIRRADSFLDGVNSVDDDKVKIFIAECIRFDKYIFEQDITKRWAELYLPVVIRNINKYDRDISKMVIQKNKVEMERTDPLFLEIEEYLKKHEKILTENNLGDFYNKRYIEISEDIKYLCGECKERNIRIPEFD